MVKLAVAILNRTVSASPGFDSRPMHFDLVMEMVVVVWALSFCVVLCGRNSAKVGNCLMGRGS